MSKAVSYDQFCNHYSLDSGAPESKKEYEEYCEKLDTVNSVFADEITKEALGKAKDSTK